MIVMRWMDHVPGGLLLVSGDVSIADRPDKTGVGAPEPVALVALGGGEDPNSGRGIGFAGRGAVVAVGLQVLHEAHVSLAIPHGRPAFHHAEGLRVLAVLGPPAIEAEIHIIHVGKLGPSAGDVVTFVRRAIEPELVVEGFAIHRLHLGQAPAAEVRLAHGIVVNEFAHPLRGFGIAHLAGGMLAAGPGVVRVVKPGDIEHVVIQQTTTPVVEFGLRGAGS